MRKIYEDSTKNLKQHPKMNWTEKCLAMKAYMDTGLKNFTSIHNRLAIEMNWYFEETDILEWMTREKTMLIQKDSSKKQLPITTDS